MQSFQGDSSQEMGLGWDADDKLLLAVVRIGLIEGRACPISMALTLDHLECGRNSSVEL